MAVGFMQLSRYTDYAFRVLLYTAASAKRSTLKEIAEYYGISIEHLRKVVHALGRLGYLNTFKGKSGGVELGSNALGLRLGDIYREFELSKGEVIDCNKLQCALIPSCTLKGILHRSERAFIAELDKYTLKDLINDGLVDLVTQPISVPISISIPVPRNS